ncbi:MAG: glycosyltransferase [Erysipelotrichaceae bacterium]|jgi:glycosyltransferase involved in cell wall biosynthesis|nr:glycosyltransferase [Erysipelotrichaceae bacterium]
MKVLIVFNYPAPYKVEFFNELGKSIDLTVVFEREKSKSRDPNFYSKEQYNFKHVFLMRGVIGEENSNSSELIKYIKTNHSSFDIIIMNGYSTLTEMRTIHYMNKHKIKWSLLVNGGVIHKDSLCKKMLKKYLISSANYYLSPSKEVNKYLIHYGAKEKNIFIYPNSTIHDVDVLVDPLTTHEKDAIRKKYNLSNNKIFISSSQFVARKNNMELIKIFAKREETLLLVGSGKEKQKYLNYISKNDIGNITIMPFMNKKELLHLMSGCDGFITLSKEDIYGHTVNEAMSQGLPVISSNKVMSAYNLIKNGVNGFIVDIDNIQEINTSISALNNTMAEAAIESAKNNTIEKMKSIIINDLEEMAK